MAVNWVTTSGSYMEKSAIFGAAAFEITGNVNVTTAKTNKVAVLQPDSGEWPRWQISFHWSVTPTGSVDIYLVYEDSDNDWHILGGQTVDIVPTIAGLDSQLSDIIAPADAINVGVIAENYTDGTLKIKVRGVK